MPDTTVKKNKKILLAEDDRFISLAYKDGLTRAGFEVVHAADGVEAIKMLKEFTPDLVLLDIIMPEKNGFEVLEDMRKDEKLKKVPVIVLSNLSQDADIKKGKELGAVDYWVKSNLSMAEVVERLEKILK